MLSPMPKKSPIRVQQNPLDSHGNRWGRVKSSKEAMRSDIEEVVRSDSNEKSCEEEVVRSNKESHKEEVGDLNVLMRFEGNGPQLNWQPGGTQPDPRCHGMTVEEGQGTAGLLRSCGGRQG